MTPWHRQLENIMLVMTKVMAMLVMTMMRVVVMLMISVIRTMRGKLTLCAQEAPSTSFIVLDPKDLKELGRWGNHDDFEY